MNKLVAIFASVFFFIAGSNAFAVTPKEISAIMEDNGYTVVDVSNNMVAVSYQGLAIMIAIDGADGDLSYLTYLVDVDSTTVGYEFLNRFNNEVKFGRAYVDRDGDVAIQMDRNASGGVSAENVESDFDVFLMLVYKFIEDIRSQTTV
ncbi:MAG: YbjN domain-containing protein [bacterium]